MANRTMNPGDSLSSSATPRMGGQILGRCCTQLRSLMGVQCIKDRRFQSLTCSQHKNLEPFIRLQLQRATPKVRCDVILRKADWMAPFRFEHELEPESSTAPDRSDHDRAQSLENGHGPRPSGDGDGTRHSGDGVDIVNTIRQIRDEMRNLTLTVNNRRPSPPSAGTTNNQASSPEPRVLAATNQARASGSSVEIPSPHVAPSMPLNTLRQIIRDEMRNLRVNYPRPSPPPAGTTNNQASIPDPRVPAATNARAGGSGVKTPRLHAAQAMTPTSPQSQSAGVLAATNSRTGGSGFQMPPLHAPHPMPLPSPRNQNAGVLAASNQAGAGGSSFQMPPPHAPHPMPPASPENENAGILATTSRAGAGGSGVEMPPLHAPPELRSETPQLHVPPEPRSEIPQLHAPPGLLSETPQLHAPPELRSETPQLHAPPELRSETPQLHELHSKTPQLHVPPEPRSEIPQLHAPPGLLSETPQLHAPPGLLSETPQLHAPPELRSETPQLHVPPELRSETPERAFDNLSPPHPRLWSPPSVARHLSACPDAPLTPEGHPVSRFMPQNQLPRTLWSG